MKSLISLRGVAVSSPQGPILGNIDLDVPERGVTVLLGPAGVGKSTLLRLMAGRLDEDVYSVSGEVDRRIDDVLFVPQPVRRRAGEPSDDDAITLTRALDGAHGLLLLDEPDRRVGPEGVEGLAELLTAYGRRAAAVVVTHHVELARRIADTAHLICAGAVVASASGEDLFSRPPNVLVAKFVREGNCWPEAAPPLPSHFHWVVPDALAGMARPGLLRDFDDDLASIALAGVTLVVSLLEEPPKVAAFRSFGLDIRHFPIVDMNVPAVGPTVALCRDLTRAVRAGEKVVVHCHGGLGRTGTILAAMLVFEGKSAAQAIEAVRAVEPHYIQNRAQEAFVERFADAIHGEAEPPPRLCS